VRAVAVDTSVVVAAFASWHEKHDLARHAIESGVRLVDQCALESYSVLTRLPPPHRVPAEVARDFLRVQFPEAYLRIGSHAQRRFLLGLADLGIVGGAVYDALVAATAAEHKAVLLSCDRRAMLTYERCGARYEFM
jgi:predicted nucleic acid-binding protein